MGRTYAGILGPLAFTTVLARSLIDGGRVPVTLVSATMCLFAFAAVGYLVGRIADSIVWDAAQARFRQGRQAPRETGQTDAA